MRATVDEASGPRSYFKGAPEVVLARCALTAEERATWAARVDEGARGGYRVIALATGPGEAEDELELLGIVMLWDPPRSEVPDAIATAQRAGVRVMMLTGDHPGTAKAVAEKIGLREVRVMTGAEVEPLDDAELLEAVRTHDVFARVTPEHKLRLVEALKADGQIVAVTGDGVNDAPALKRSDVGIAMGMRGSDVSREVADLVLLDDNFATIIGAIAEGRCIYENLQTYVRYTFSTNVALMLLVLGGAIGSYAEGLRDSAGMLFLPLTALQLLWINFLGDGPPSLALAVDRTQGVMDHPPRPPKSDLLDDASRRFILADGAVKGLLGLALLLVLPILGATLIATQTVVFLFESIGKLVTAYPARRVRHEHDPNLVLHGAMLLGIGIQILTVVVPGLRDVLRLDGIDRMAWAILGAALVLGWLVSEGIAARARRGTAQVSARSSLA
jgi:Ca2+-transporting ATPase